MKLRRWRAWQEVRGFGIFKWSGWRPSEGCFSVLLAKLNRNSKTVVVADGGGNLDNEAFANETWHLGHVLFSKTRHREKEKRAKAVRDSGFRRVWLSQSPHAPQGTRVAMFISSAACAKLIPEQ
jgi:hypothetical protein